MKIVVFGLSISSAWGNGHATLLRGLFRALHESGHRIHFFEKDVPYYAAHRDATRFPFADLYLYREFSDVVPLAKTLLDRADVGLITSYCPDGVAAAELVFDSHAGRTVFYDMDTPVTLARLERGEQVTYLPAAGLRNFDLALSYTGGRALELLKERLGAQRVAALYGWVDPRVYEPFPADSAYESDLSYLGTYSADRQRAVDEMFLKPASILPGRQFLIAGAMYPEKGAWPSNVKHLEHVAPAEHCAFYSSSPLTLNVTRGAMAAMGHCPSGRLFEAAACGTAVLTDRWSGLEEFFSPGSEILTAESTDDVLGYLKADREEIALVGKRARARALDCHTADIRAQRLIDLIEMGPQSDPVPEWATIQGV